MKLDAYLVEASFGGLLMALIPIAEGYFSATLILDSKRLSFVFEHPVQ